MKNLKSAPLHPYLRRALEFVEGDQFHERAAILGSRLGVCGRTIQRVLASDHVRLTTADKICTGLEIDHPSLLWPEYSEPETCQAGHVINEKNSYFGHSGKYTECKLCRSERDAERYAKQREAKAEA